MSYAVCKHEVWTEDPCENIPKLSGHNVVAIANDEDPYYIQHFESWNDLNVFIGLLKSAGNKAWGKEK